MLKNAVLALLFLLSHQLSAQSFSGNGWFLAPHDTLRVLIVFVEIEYDVNPELEDLPNGNKAWMPGLLPAYADSLFDHGPAAGQVGRMSTYYREMSLGHLTVYGDYYPELVRLPYSLVSKQGQTAIAKEVGSVLNAASSFVSAHGYAKEAFDFWVKKPGTGLPKEPRGGDFAGFDHVMVITRNYHKLPKENGNASGSSLAMILGKLTDSYSFFSGGHSPPGVILRHELNHLFIGGNNFHSGGGNSWRFRGYFPFVQGGWAMMGGGNSSFLCASGWDRYWLNWSHPEADWLIATKNEWGEIVRSDITRSDTAHRFILRDFIKTGDLVRIALPFLPETEYQQWLWLENHITAHSGGSMYDVLQYEHYECLEDSRAGLHAYIQVDANEREGKNIYGQVNSDFLRPLPADGNHDVQWEKEAPDLGYCVSNLPYIPYYRLPKFENPLTGNHALEQYYYDQGEAETLDHSQIRIPQNFLYQNEYKRNTMLGHPRHGFRKGENAVLGVGTNPSSANMLAFLNSRQPGAIGEIANQTIHISGIRVEILEALPENALLIEIRFDDHIINSPQRWCAPKIVLHDHRKGGADITVNSTLMIDRGQTMTRFDRPEIVDGRKYFTDATEMVVLSDAEVSITGELIVDGESKIIMQQRSRMIVAEMGILEVKNGVVVFEQGANADMLGRLIIRKGGKVECEDFETYRALKKRTKGKKRLIAMDSRQPNEKLGADAD